MEEVKIGFLGFGNVGTGAYKIIRDNGNDIFLSEGVRLKVAKILVRDINKKRNVEVDNSILTDKFEGISIVAEFMGGVEPARDYVVSCLKNKKMDWSFRRLPKKTEWVFIMKQVWQEVFRL